MKILILGATGMLGHKLVQRFAPSHDVTAACRAPVAKGLISPACDDFRLIEGFNAQDLPSLMKLLADVQPDAVINCIGVIKQLDAAKDPVICTEINSLFPHYLARACRLSGARMIHISTDCVFSGTKGRPYTEDDRPDPVDTYGLSKALGEVAEPPALTLRTSIIGPELKGRLGLFEWFLSKRGHRVNGYRQALYTGLTTQALADVIVELLSRETMPTGILQVASSSISKFDLLQLINEVFDLRAEIVPDDTVVCDRRLNGSRFADATAIRTPSWQEMIDQMYEDSQKVKGPHHGA